MRFGIDFDGTMKGSSTIDPKERAMWKAIVDILINNGHSVYIVTSRWGTPYDIKEIDDYLRPWDVKPQVIFCGSIPKAEMCKMVTGHTMDIVIDDMPELWIKI